MPVSTSESEKIDWRNYSLPANKSGLKFSLKQPKIDALSIARCSGVTRDPSGLILLLNLA